jgi:hypothetical protein
VAVRKIKNRGGSITGQFPSFKMPTQMIQYESTIERDLCYVLEFDEGVTHYEAQPFRIYYIGGDTKVHSYTPDFHVFHADGTKDIVECKPNTRLYDQHTQQQMEIGQAWADANDHTFVVITDEELRQGHNLANIKLLWRFRQMAIEYKLVTRTIEYLKQRPQGASLMEVAAYAESSPERYALAPFLLCLVFQRVLLTDLAQPLSPESQLWLPIMNQ